MIPKQEKRMSARFKQAQIAARKCIDEYPDDINLYNAFVLGVSWADKHPTKKTGVWNLLKALFRELIHD